MTQNLFAAPGSVGHLLSSHRADFEYRIEYGAMLTGVEAPALRVMKRLKSVSKRPEREFEAPEMSS